MEVWQCLIECFHSETQTLNELEKVVCDIVRLLFVSSVMQLALSVAFVFVNKALSCVSKGKKVDGSLFLEH